MQMAATEGTAKHADMGRFVNVKIHVRKRSSNSNILRKKSKLNKYSVPFVRLAAIRA